MDQIIIEGSRALRGEVQISGSKNSALPCLFATLLTDDECVLQNVPHLVDIHTTCSLLTHLGKKIIRKEDTVTVLPGEKLHTEAPYDLVRKMRASVLVLGPLLARTGQAAASLPGGCAIGVRPINIHLAGFEEMGAKTELSEGIVRLKAKKLKGKKIALDFPSVGATENLLMASVLADGQTTIVNAAKEPEIVDLADCLIAMGAEIRGAGTDTIVIEGKKYLHGTVHRVIPDRIEAATYLIAAAATKGKLKLNGVIPEHLKIVIDFLIKTGVDIVVEKNGAGQEKNLLCGYKKPFKPVNITTGPYPEFPTDVQAQWMSLMSLARGKSVIREDVFENRYLHAAELTRMGADIQIEERGAVVTGVKRLSGAHVMVSDLRAGAALVIAGLAAEGKTVIHRVYHLDRGYEKIEKKLNAVGARIERVTS